MKVDNFHRSPGIEPGACVVISQTLLLGSRLIHVTNVTNVTNVTVILSPEIELSLSFRGKKNISDDVPGGFLNEY